jgi:hypothetical protein
MNKTVFNIFLENEGKMKVFYKLKNEKMIKAKLTTNKDSPTSPWRIDPYTHHVRGNVHKNLPPFLSLLITN